MAAMALARASSVMRRVMPPSMNPGQTQLTRMRREDNSFDREWVRPEAEANKKAASGGERRGAHGTFDCCYSLSHHMRLLLPPLIH